MQRNKPGGHEHSCAASRAVRIFDTPSLSFWENKYIYLYDIHTYTGGLKLPGYFLLSLRMFDLANPKQYTLIQNTWETPIKTMNTENYLIFLV